MALVRRATAFCHLHLFNQLHYESSVNCVLQDVPFVDFNLDLLHMIDLTDIFVIIMYVLVFLPNRSYLSKSG